MDKRECILTVYCLTYNHEKYIKKTLDGFINQKTKYDYKVIVHDDMSTDNTRKIIEQYAQKYPQIVPIYQNENQYSKGIGIYDTYIRPALEGKYTAICEGDDYWCDENKLQTQIEYMETHPDCSLCVHNTEMITESGKRKHKYFNSSKKEEDYSAENVIECGGGGLFHTSSFVYRTQYRDEKPDDFSITGIGDYTLAMYLAMRGKVHYFPQIMSKYRVGSINSWVKKNSRTVEKYNQFVENEVNELEKINKLTYYQYDLSYKKAKMRLEYEKLIKNRQLWKVFKNKDYSRVFEEKTFGEKLRLLIKYILHRN